ncbi:hypothetical protein [Leisingera sp. ANG-Vp]|uniref:hypothetical protein n=1 Tax=Leisingera sp. ANG-Vp TaxID=1577896 RepID=UPI00057C880C|nr:hypothetical protein [Leisingera sp. ANG-Vp]KIC15869.1 hypothetical protein RA20_17635 [Leisingera sp. ANG-Vp]
MLTPSRQARDLLSRISGKVSSRIRPAARPEPAPSPAPSPAPAEELLTRPLEDSLSIPVCSSEDDPDSTGAQNRGQFLARQERWEDLSRQIREADEARTATRCGLPVADLIAYGARADVVNATEHALAEEEDASSRSLIRGLMAFEALRAEHRNDPYLTALVALAHIDIGWAWRTPGKGQAADPSSRHRCAAHFDRAAALLQPLADGSCNSPFLKGAQCSLLAGHNGEALQVADEFSALIDLAPNNHRHMRTLGTHMLPRWSGSYAALELEARRTASRTEGIWGAGGYTWVYFDAITIDDQACARVDTRFFLDGLRDIVAANPSQDMINLLAAYCTVTLRKGLGQNLQADVPRLKIAEAADWLIRDHLKELHPLVWAHAAEGFDNSARITSLSRFAARGHAGALQAIAGQFREEIEGGQKVAFTEKGLQFSPA